MDGMGAPPTRHSCHSGALLSQDIKFIGDKAFYRVVWSLVPIKPVREALEVIRKEVSQDRQRIFDRMFIL